MTTTPPPPERLHTPPTPLHGPKYDSWQPYSPRRSTRAARGLIKPAEPTSPSATPARQRTQFHSLADTTPAPIATPSRRKTPLHRQPSSQTLSPPSSPEIRSQSHAAASSKQATASASYLDTDNSDNGISDSALDASDEPLAMLPTPRKTPRKRDHTALQNSATRTIHLRPYAPGDILPTPQRRRQRFTLDSPHDTAAHLAVPVFTDSQDRIPEMVQSDDNPFAGPRQPARNRPRSKRHNPHNTEERAMERSYQRDEGLIYVFRGRKIFRRYADAPQSDDDAPHHRMDGQTARIRHMAGEPAQRRITRSSLKPRRLFADNERDASVDPDEEAPTDIEDESAHTARTSGTTPQLSFEEVPSADEGAQILVADTPLPAPVARKGKKPSPFDSWPRQKPGSSSRVASGVKRRAEDAEEGPVGKRTRSGAHAGAAA